MSMNDIDVLLDFLSCPLGSADKVLEKFAALSGAIRQGEGLEQFVFKEGFRKNRVLLVAHADTYWDNEYNRNAAQQQNLSNSDGIIRNKNGGLGADDRAGCAIIWLLKEMGHSILITNGEEQGRKGSTWLMSNKNNYDIAEKINRTHQFIIQLDRRNGEDFKCYSVGTNEFRTYVSQATKYTEWLEPGRSVYTDIVTLCRDICGVNLSIGYRNEHHENEHLVVDEWVNTLNICRKWLSDRELPHFSRNANNA